MSGIRSDRVRVLIVDDEPSLAVLLSVAARGAGPSPFPAARGRSTPRAAHGQGVPRAALERRVLTYAIRPPEDGR